MRLKRTRSVAVLACTRFVFSALSCTALACTAFDPSLVDVDASDASTVQPDAGVDAALPDAPPADSATDAGTDTATDSAVDAEPDVMDANVFDVPSDVPIDAPGCTPNADGVWVWQPTVLSENTEANLAAIAAAGFGRVFIEAEAFATDESGAIVEIVAAAAAHCMEVELLFGYAPWAYTPMHGYIRSVVRRALAQFGPGDVMPRAIHLDVEPHTLPEWMSDQSGIADQWVAMLEGVAAECGDVPLIADVPFWYHEVMLTRAGETISLLHWTLRATDGVAILAYRDTAEGANGIVELSRPSLTIADAVGGTVSVGVETHCGVEPTHVTFCEEGFAAFRVETERARTFLEPHASFAGMAVHSWTSFQNLTP